MTSKSSNSIFIVKEYREFLEDLKNFNPKLYKQLCNKIKEIRLNPFKSKFKNLKNTQGYKRARSGEYRIVYFVEGNKIFITRIGPRNKVYKKNFTIKNFSIAPP